MYNVLAILIMADMVCLACTLYAETVESRSSAGSVCMVYGLYGMLELKLCFEILLLLNMVDMD